MMRASASTQVSLDYESEKDLAVKLRVLQKLAPMLMIMMESKTYEKSSLPGVQDKPHLLRIQEWDDLDPDSSKVRLFRPVIFVAAQFYTLVPDPGIKYVRTGPNVVFRILPV